VSRERAKLRHRGLDQVLFQPSPLSRIGARPVQAGRVRTAFRGFDVADVAAMTDRDVDRPVEDASIIRNRAPRSVADLLFEFCEPVQRRARRARYRRAG
jgi:hypothetical protein